MKLVDMKIKGIILGALLMVIGFGANAQETQHPKEQKLEETEVSEEVRNTFEDEFASAKDVEWSKKGEMVEAEFEAEGEEKTAHFDDSGKLKMVKTEIKRNELPQAVQQTLNRDYQDYRLKEFAKVEKDGKTHYWIEGSKEGQTKEMYFDSSGKKIEKDKKKEKSQRM